MRVTSHGPHPPSHITLAEPWATPANGCGARTWAQGGTTVMLLGVAWLLSPALGTGTVLWLGTLAMVP